MTSAGLSRTAGATVNFVGGTNNATPLGTSSNQLVFSNLLTTNSGTAGSINGGLQYLGNQGNILPYAEVNGLANNGDFATYTSSGIAAFTNYQLVPFVGNNTLSANAGDIVKVIALGSVAYTLTAASNLSVGALFIDNLTGAVVTVNVPNALTISSGLFMSEGSGAAGNTFVGGQINLGSEGIVFNNNSGTGNTNINTVVSGSGGLTLGGTGGTLVLPAASPNLTGNTSINAGTITLGSAASVASGNLTVAGTATLQGTQGLTFGTSQAVTLNNANLTFGNANAVPITFSGTTTLLGTSTLTVTDTGGVYLNGQITDGGISSSGGLILAGTGTIFLNDQGSSSSNYLGGTYINGATVVVGDSTALGTNTSSQTLGITAGAIVPSTPVTFNQTLVLNGAVTLSGTSSANNITFSSPTTLTATTTLTDNNLGTVTFSASIGEAGGARALTINGPGAVSLTPTSGTNTYSGGTTINMTGGGASFGTVIVNAGSTASATSSNPLYSSSLGSGTLTLTSGVLDATGSTTLTYNNVVSIGAGPVVLAGAATTFNGTVGLTATATLLAANTTIVNGIVTGAFGLTLSGVPVVSGANTFSPTGSVALTAANTFTGVTTVSGGTLSVSGNGTLPSAPSTTTSSNAAQTLAFGGTVTGGTFTLTFNGQTTSTINYSTTAATLQSNILTALTALSNVGTNNVTVNATSATSVLITFQNVLGDAPQSLMTASAAGLTGTGPTTTFTSTTTGVAPITVNAGGTLTLDNSGTNVLNRLNTTGIVTEVAITNASSQAGYTVAPTVTFSAPASGTTATGTAVMANGVITAVTITNAGSGYTSAPTITFTGGGATTAATATAFLTSNLVLNGGTFNFNGTNVANTTTTQAIGTVTLGGGNSMIVSTTGSGGASTLLFGGYTRGVGTTVTFQAGATGNQTFNNSSNIISFASNYTSTNGVVQGAYVNDASTISAPGVNSGNPITSTFKYATNSGTNVVAQTTYVALSTTGGNLSTDNVLAISSTTLTAADTFNSLLLVGSGINITGGALTVSRVASSGGSNSFGTSSTDNSVPLLAAPIINGVQATTEEVVLVNSGTLALNAPFYGTGGLTISGAGTLSLPNANVTTGVTGASLTGGGAGYTLAPTVTFSAPGGSGTTAQGYAVLTSGAVSSIVITNPGSGYVTAPTVTFTGGGFTTTAAATATIGTNTASYTGGTVFDGGQAANSGTLTLGVNNAIPGTSGTLTLNNGTLSTSAALLIPNAVTLTSNVGYVTFGGSGSYTFNGAVTGVATSVVTLTTNATTTINGIVGGAVAATLIKQGASTLALSGANTFTGTVIIGAGIVITQSATGVSSAGNVIVTNGTTLEVQQITNATLAVTAKLTVLGIGATGTTGAIEMLGGGTGANTLSGTVALIGDTTIGVDVGQLTMSGVISGAAAVTKVGLGMLSLGTGAQHLQRRDDR